jgi:hypothetical protein
VTATVPGPGGLLVTGRGIKQLVRSVSRAEHEAKAHASGPCDGHGEDHLHAGRGRPGNEV